MQQVLSISQVNEYIRSKMDNDSFLSQIAVRGEISNYKMYPSGHHYFTLKDESSALKCVMFKGNAMRLRFRPENGMQVIAVGKISVYPRDGAYQLYCTAMMVDGIGDLHTAFEQLKAKLAAQGLFDPQHKKVLPPYPGIIGIVTSPAGAAVHDMLRILSKRYPVAQVKLFPVRVQGEEAPEEIAAAIRYANRYQLADLLIVGRGGGSIEDLWAFNDERVAYAIYDSEIPVISAVGHEPDVTISDYVADLRAATPSNAAELAVPDQEALLQNIDTSYASMIANYQQRLLYARHQLNALASSGVLKSPTGYLEKKVKELLFLKQRLEGIQRQRITLDRNRYIQAVSKLDAMSPLKVLSRGYSMVQKDDGSILHRVSEVKPNDVIAVFLSDGKLKASVVEKEEMS